MIDLNKEESRILVVDDEESLRLTFKTFLSREGYGPVTVASTFEEAQELIEAKKLIDDDWSPEALDAMDEPTETSRDRLAKAEPFESGFIERIGRAGFTKSPKKLLNL